MPIIKSAKKKLKQDKKRRLFNMRVRRAYKKAVKLVQETPIISNLREAYRHLDMAAKKHVIHVNKAARLKSRFSRLVNQNLKTSK